MLTAPDGQMLQQAPYPTELADLVGRCRYRPGWRLELRDLARDYDGPRNARHVLAGGLTLVVTTWGWDSYHRPVQSSHRFETEGTCSDCGEPFPCSSYALDGRPDDAPRVPYRVNHYRIVPAATFTRASWRRWLFEQLVDVERHETMEFFEIEGEGRPYAATHGPGDDPYVVHDYASDEQRRTRFTGEVLA